MCDGHLLPCGRDHERNMPEELFLPDTGQESAVPEWLRMSTRLDDEKPDRQSDAESLNEPHREAKRKPFSGPKR